MIKCCSCVTRGLCAIRCTIVATRGVSQACGRQCVNTSACNSNGWLASFWVLLNKKLVWCSHVISDSSNKHIHHVAFAQEITFILKRKNQNSKMIICIMLNCLQICNHSDKSCSTFVYLQRT